MSGQTENVFVNAEFQIKRDTVENWETLNPILEAGEPALVVDENDKPKYLKIGDGKTTWSELIRFNYPDQTYDPESENAQSGKAVAEAIKSISSGNPKSEIKDDILYLLVNETSLKATVTSDGVLVIR